MVALSTGHEDILIAIIGAFGLVLVALVPVLVSIRRASDRSTVRFDEMAMHLPPNGTRLYQMVEATNMTVQELQQQATKTETVLLEHLAWSHRQMDRLKDEGT